MDEARLIGKLRLIEALFYCATTEGEKVATQRRLRQPLFPAFSERTMPTEQLGVSNG
jgi:hypothetical protein